MTVKSELFCKKFQLFNRRAKLFSRQLKASELLWADELSSLNWSRRQQLVSFCAQKIPFYQRKFKAIGFEPGDLKTEADFARLPILEKNEIRENEDNIVNPAFDKDALGVSTTGGTTGNPLRTYNDPRVPLSVISWRTLRWWGVNPSDNSGYLYRAIPHGIRHVLQDIKLLPTRRCYLSAMDMTERKMQSFYASLKKRRAKYLVGYVGAIDAFATFIERKGLSLPVLKAVWTTSSPLPQMKRKYLTKMYGCPVYTQYGSCEFYWIAAECQRQSGLHIASDIRHVNVVEDDRPVKIGDYGDLLVTDLTNYAFPLLRYRLGDRGRLLRNACDCGLPFPLMDYVKGRISDSIHLPDGTIIPGEYWTTIFDDYPTTIKSFQVIQRKDYSIEVRFEPYGDDFTSVIETVSCILKKKLDERVPLRFCKTNVVINEGGKMRFVTSELANQRSVSYEDD